MIYFITSHITFSGLFFLHVSFDRHFYKVAFPTKAHTRVLDPHFKHLADSLLSSGRAFINTGERLMKHSGARSGYEALQTSRSIIYTRHFLSQGSGFARTHSLTQESHSVFQKKERAALWEHRQRNSLHPSGSGCSVKTIHLWTKSKLKPTLFHLT